MNRSKVFVLGGLLSATLLMPALPALADPKGKSEHQQRENHGQHKGWEKHQAKKFKHDEHDRRHYRRPDPRRYHRDVRYDNRGHHNKAEIRQFSAALGLPTADKPQMACLSSRIPYGEAVSPEKLKMIEGKI